MKSISIIALIFFIMVTTGCSNQTNMPGPEKAQAWEQILSEQIRLMGHRNWIVVVDAAYPLQSSPGISTVVSDLDHLATIEEVLTLIEKQPHIRPITYVDMEIDYVEEAAAPGMSDYRAALASLLGSGPPQKLLHEDIISKLDEASKQFNILIIKTDFDIPYTSVFFQLDCKYWDEESEIALRSQIEGE